jgi:hypothetical protein
LPHKWHNRTVEEGQEQLARYLDTPGLRQGYLVIFDPGDKEWEEKLYYKETDYNGKISRQGNHTRKLVVP